MREQWPTLDTPLAMSLFGPRRQPRVKQRQLAPGSYLTDGEHLFRVLSLFLYGPSMLVSIEDCLTLRTHAYAASELQTRRLRLVRGNPAGAITSPADVGLPDEYRAALH
jgi:hypothetical protein